MSTIRYDQVGQRVKCELAAINHDSILLGMELSQLAMPEGSYIFTVQNYYLRPSDVIIYLQVSVLKFNAYTWIALHNNCEFVSVQHFINGFMTYKNLGMFYPLRHSRCEL